jgi:plastocyanin
VTDSAGAPEAGSFLAVAPCPFEADYATGTGTVTFGFLGTPAGFSYDPKCLLIDAGGSVNFSGSFVAHPLYPSARRGTRANNPISGVSSGDSTVVVFPNPGFFAYFCGAHGAADDGTAMAGVIWAR